MNASTKPMKMPRTPAIMFLALLCAPAAPSQVQDLSAHQAAKPRATVAFAHSLPKLDGGRLEAKVVEVYYGPGEASRPHSHPCPVIGYVVQGTIRTQVKGQPEVLVHVGESFYEPPNGLHLVSANASGTAPASFLAFFVCDHNAPLSTDARANSTSGGR
jgi:quercetin dioxygenase-like cupin family protein